jgi:hypothetical protein
MPAVAPVHRARANGLHAIALYRLSKVDTNRERASKMDYSQHMVRLVRRAIEASSCGAASAAVPAHHVCTAVLRFHGEQQGVAAIISEQL